MSKARDRASGQILAALPPLGIAHLHIAPCALIGVHFALLEVLYGVFLFTSHVESTLWISAGIGVLQNTPFFSHLVAVAASIPLIVAFTNRIAQWMLGHCHSVRVSSLFAPIFLVDRTASALLTACTPALSQAALGTVRLGDGAPWLAAAKARFANSFAHFPYRLPAARAHREGSRALLL